MRQTYAASAKRYLQLADHLLISTYPLVKDTKILLGVLTNLAQAHINTIIYALSAKVPPLKTEKAQFEQFMHHFKTEVSEEEMKSIQIIYDLVEEHKTSTIEFARKQKLVMCDNHYEFYALTPESLKKHLRHARNIQKKLIG